MRLWYTNPWREGFPARVFPVTGHVPHHRSPNPAGDTATTRSPSGEMPHLFLYIPGAGEYSAPSWEREYNRSSWQRGNLLQTRIRVSGVSSGEIVRASQEDRSAGL
ncbi:MAG TPA: hypothetical protein VEL31_23645 [Ktedonobacteraceae bacterium]|nr:hypothetical protein [Ktedonobacteraceae bacterium]